MFTHKITVECWSHTDKGLTHKQVIEVEVLDGIEDRDIASEMTDAVGEAARDFAQQAFDHPEGVVKGFEAFLARRAAALARE